MPDRGRWGAYIAGCVFLPAVYGILNLANMFFFTFLTNLGHAMKLLHQEAFHGAFLCLQGTGTFPVQHSVSVFLLHSASAAPSVALSLVVTRGTPSGKLLTHSQNHPIEILQHFPRNLQLMMVLKCSQQVHKDLAPVRQTVFAQVSSSCMEQLSVNKGTKDVCQKKTEIINKIGKRELR